VLIIDNFAGGGGASEGIEEAMGRPCDYAINHDRLALAMHRRNHPGTRHVLSSVWDVDPEELCEGRPVDLGWFSPDCTYFSAARGGKPFRDKNRANRRRALPGIVTRWAKRVRPRVIMLENVKEFAEWGPLLPDGRPDPARRGLIFRRWHRQLENLGYQVDMRVMDCAEYGAPTRRRRLFVIARCDGREIVFPEATHGGLPYQRPYRTAAECIDWSIPTVSIFEREALGKKPLVEASLRRIARGIERHVINEPRPFIVPLTHQGERRAHGVDEPLPTITGAHRGEFALVAPFWVNTRNGERHGEHGEQAPRVRDIREPMPTVTAQGSQGALCVAYLAKHYGGHEGPGISLREPLSTITCQDHHALVLAFLARYNGRSVGQDLREPLSTIDTTDRFALVTVGAEKRCIVDIRTRMLVARELYRAQSFRDSYIIDHGLEEDGSAVPFTGTAQTHMCGNSVPPVMAKALVQANVIEQVEERAA
jgi:DNA (cytosine-5)-methyltransferase 1